MNQKGIPKDAFDGILKRAVAETYSFRRQYANESDFKLELFHRLALAEYNGISIASTPTGTSTPYLHSEGKFENVQNGPKTDILACNPYQPRRHDYNYTVDYLIELKKRYNEASLSQDRKKIEGCANKCKGVYLIGDQTAIRRTNSRLPEFIQLIERKDIPSVDMPPEPHVVSDIDSTLKIVRFSIQECLKFYGERNHRLHSFFWRNYMVDEEGGRCTFPCEGDFVAHLYHRLRMKLLSAAEIQSEVNTGSSNLRIDLQVSNPSDGWSIPIEIKMNWNQFKRKYATIDGQKRQKPEEASQILNKFRDVSSKCLRCSPILVVIQGVWAHYGDNRQRSLNILRQSPVSFELIYFDEDATAPVSKERWYV